MLRAYLAFNALLYLFLGVWCTIDPMGTSAAIGFALPNDSARSEFLTIYGGLEVGLGLFFLAATLHPRIRDGGLAMAVLLYVCLAAWRWWTIGTSEDLNGFVRFIVWVETGLALAALGLAWRTWGHPPAPQE